MTVFEYSEGKVKIGNLFSDCQPRTRRQCVKMSEYAAPDFRHYAVEKSAEGKSLMKQFTDVFQLEVFIPTLFKPFESTFISHISTYLDVIAYLYIFD
uniref:Uncharacterized protein n=1 Tax=Rhodnius prolixus TaxID=13249 RepID=T1HLW5_RHOPR